MQDSGLRDSLERLVREAPGAVDSALRVVAIQGLREIKTGLPKRTGNLRRTYNYRKTGVHQFTIASNSRYADVVENGARAHTVYPKRAKMLTIPLRDSVLTGTRAQISKPALSRLFAAIRKGGRPAGEIYQSVGIALAKRANIPARKGSHFLRDKIGPSLQRAIETEILRAIRRVSGGAI